MSERRFTIYLCHGCGWIQGEEEPDLTCAQCGEPRSFIEKIEVEIASQQGKRWPSAAMGLDPDCAPRGGPLAPGEAA